MQVRAGLAEADITVYRRGALTMGYGDMRGGIDGVDEPLRARALVLEDPVGAPEDGRSRLAYACLDLCFITDGLRRAIVERLVARPEMGLAPHRVMITATHTHSGPSGFADDVFYSANAPGLCPEVVDGIADGVVDALVAATARLRAARLSYCEHRLGRVDWVHRRGAHADRPIDPVMRVLRVDGADGRPLGVLNAFALHGTCLHGEGRRLHPDHKGLSAVLMSRWLADEAPADHPFVAIFAQEAAGDITPNGRLDRRRGVFVGPDDDDHRSVVIVAEAQARAAMEAWRAAADRPLAGERLDARMSRARFSDRAFETVDGRAARTTPTRLGLAMALGTRDGRGPLAPLEGLYHRIARRRRRTRPEDPKLPFFEFARGRRSRIAGLLPIDLLRAVPGRHAAFFRRGLRSGAMDAPWAPLELPVQVFAIGRLRVAAVAGEPTHDAGARIRAVLVDSDTCEHVIVQGYANDYGSYVTTGDEYARQHYEGGCTLYGPATLDLWCAELKALGDRLDAGAPQASIPPRSEAPAPGGPHFEGGYPRPRRAHGLPRDLRGAHGVDRFDTIIVGAGFAGLRAGITLQQAGQRVLLLEASERVGGRARSTADGADLGCGFIGAHQTHAMALVDALGFERVDYVRTAPQNPCFRSETVEGVEDMLLDDTWFRIQGCKKDSALRDRLRLLQMMVEWIAIENLIDQARPGRGPLARRLDRMTVRAWMDRMDVRPKHRDLIRLAANGIWSAEPADMSLLYLLWYSATNNGLLHIANDQADGPQQFGVKGGLGGLAHAFGERFRGDLRLQTPVERIERRADGFRVSAGGQIFEADDVIVAATPAAVGRHVEFDPPLPEATRRVLDQPMGHAVKAIVEYDTRWWWYDDGRQFQWYGGMAGTPLEWMLDISEPERGVYRFCAFMNPPEGLSDDALRALFVDLFHRLSGDPRARAVTRFDVADWRASPYIGGGPVSICRPGVLTALDDRPDALEVVGGLHFAGAEYSTQYTGYVEGALRSGARAAQRILHGRVVDRDLVARGPRWALGLLATAGWANLAMVTRALGAWERCRGASAPPAPERRPGGGRAGARRGAGRGAPNRPVGASMSGSGGLVEGVGQGDDRVPLPDRRISRSGGRRSGSCG